MWAQFDMGGCGGGGGNEAQNSSGDGENCLTVSPTVVGKRWISWTGHVVRMGYPNGKAGWDSTIGEFS